MTALHRPREVASELPLSRLLVASLGVCESQVSRLKPLASRNRGSAAHACVIQQSILLLLMIKSISTLSDFSIPHQLIFVPRDSVCAGNAAEPLTASAWSVIERQSYKCEAQAVLGVDKGMDRRQEDVKRRDVLAIPRATLPASRAAAVVALTLKQTVNCSCRSAGTSPATVNTVLRHQTNGLPKTPLTLSLSLFSSVTCATRI